MARTRLSTAIGVLLVLGGCATIPRLGPAPAVRAPATLAVSSLNGVATWPRDDWWAGFRDPQLSLLIEEGWRESPDVALAAARIRVADAFAQQADVARFASFGLQGQLGGSKQSENFGVPRQFVPKGIQQVGQIAGTARFDLDLWGRNRAALAAARGDAEAARVDAAQSRLMLSTAIASAYADLAQQMMQRDLAVDALHLREATAKLTAERVQVGLDARGSLYAARSRVPAARADILTFDEMIVATRHRIAALLGAGPDRGVAIKRPNLHTLAAGIPANAGIDLVGRRPDLVAAQLRASAAERRIAVAHADFYPNLNLSVLAGLESLGFGNLLKSTSSYGNGGLAFSLPIFDAGGTAGRYRQARGQYDEAVAQYNSTLIGALREVADAYVTRAAAEPKLVEERRALADAERSRAVSVLRYRGGLSNQLPVLVDEDTLLGVRRAVVDADFRRVGLDIALIRALGGGYSAAPIQTGAR